MFDELWEPVRVRLIMEVETSGLASFRLLGRRRAFPARDGTRVPEGWPGDPNMVTKQTIQLAVRMSVMLEVQRLPSL